jgi:hypothetical protein
MIHLVIKKYKIPDSMTDLEEATDCEQDTEDEEAMDKQQGGCGLRRPISDAENEQIERRVSARLGDSTSASHGVHSTLPTGSGAGSNKSQGAGIESDTGTGTYPCGYDQDSPISKKGVLTDFINSLTDDALDKSIQLLDSYDVQNNVSLSSIIIFMPELPSSSSLSSTAADLFNIFSISCQVLQKAWAGLYKLCFIAISYCFWFSFSRLREFWKTEENL